MDREFDVTSRFENPGSRFTDRYEIVVSDSGPYEIPDYLAQVEDDVSSYLGPEVVEWRVEETTSGRGASGPAWLLLILTLPGSLRTSWEALRDVVAWVRKKYGHVHLSQGTIRDLVLLRTCVDNPGLVPEDLMVAGIGEISNYKSPSEVSHTGADVLCVLVASRSDARSWIYVVSGDGTVLHSGTEGALPSGYLYFNAPEAISGDTSGLTRLDE